MPVGRDFFYQSGAGGGSSSGQGGINYITNYGFEENTGGWATYADAAAATPVDGTGGSPNSTLSRTTTTAEILRGSAAGKFSKGAANRQGEGFSYDFTLSVQDYDGSKPLYVAFDYMTSANYAAGDIRVFVYDKDGATLLNVLSLTGGGSVGAASDPSRFVGAFYSTNGNNDYRLIFHITSTNASAYDFIVDNVSVSPQGTVPGAVVADLGTEAWTVVNGTATSSIRLSRIGNRIFLDGTVSFTSTASGLIGLTIPSKYAPSSSDYSTLGTTNIPLGWIKILDGGTGSYDGIVMLTSSSNISFFAENVGSTYMFPANTSSTVPHTWANTDQIIFQASWIVSGWAASAALSTTETMLMSAKFLASKNGTQNVASASPTKVTSWTVAKDNLSGWDSTNSRWTAPRTGRFVVNASLELGNASAELYFIHVYVNGSSVAYNFISAANPNLTINRSVDVSKGDYVEIFVDSLSDTAYDVNAVNSTFFAINEAPDFSIFSVYGPNGYETATASTTNLPATTQYGDLTSITLQPGEWDIEAAVIGHRNSASEAAWTVFAMGVSTTSGNSTSGLTLGVNWVRETRSFGFGVDASLVMPRYRVRPTSATTYYLKFSGTYSANQPQAEGTITARQVA